MLYCSETELDADREISLWFSKDELNLFQKVDEPEVYEIVLAANASPVRSKSEKRKRQASASKQKEPTAPTTESTEDKPSA